MNMNDLSYSALFADKVFENTVWNEYEDEEILNVRSISSSEGNYSMVPEIFIQSKDELLNGVSPKPVIDNESEQEMNSVPCTMVNETDHLTCVNNGNCISLNSATDNIKSTKCQLQPSSQTRDLDTPKGPLIHNEMKWIKETLNYAVYIYIFPSISPINPNHFINLLREIPGKWRHTMTSRNFCL